MDGIKKELEVDPLAIQESDDTYIEEKKPLSEEGSLLHLHLTGIKEECLDQSHDLTSVIKFEETQVPVNFSSVKCEDEEESCDLKTVKEEPNLGQPEIEDEVLIERRHLESHSSEKPYKCDVCVLMDVTKMESETNPLAIHTSDDTEVPDSKLFSEEGNLLDLHMVRIKEECLDYSYDVTSGMKSEENVEPNSFTMIKCESEEKPCDLDLAKEEVKLEVMTEEDEVFSDGGKKRKRDPNNWRRNLAKLKRNSGRGYVSPITGNEVKEKVFRKVNKCCRKRCFEIINYEEQKDCFTAFWDTGDKLHQDAMLLGYMKNKEKVCQKQKITKERNYVWGYSINVKNDNKRVCRQFLLSLFQISEMRLRTVQNSFKAGGVLEERRGKHANRPNKITENVWQLVKEHWKQIPHQEAHYSRSNTATKYFDNPELNVVKLYNAFKHYFYDKSGEPLKMGYSAYHKYFRKNSEYSFR